MASKRSSKVKTPSKPPPRPSAPPIEVDPAWLEPATDPGTGAALRSSGPPAGGVKRDTIPVEADWLEIVEEEAPNEEALSIPKAPPRPRSRSRSKSR